MVLPTMDFKYLPVKPRVALGLIFHHVFIYLQAEETVQIGSW
jgi:hypothetical protein